MAALLNPQIEHHLETIYKGTEVSDLTTLASDLIRLMRLDDVAPIKNRYINHWDQKDSGSYLLWRQRTSVGAKAPSHLKVVP